MNSRSKRTQWIVLISGLSMWATGCGSWNHHVAKHSWFSRLTARHQEPYSQCEDCGQIIMNKSQHSCGNCATVEPYYGYKATCWAAWPEGWIACPESPLTGCMLSEDAIPSNLAPAQPVAAEIICSIGPTSLEESAAENATPDTPSETLTKDQELDSPEPSADASPSDANPTVPDFSSSDWEQIEADTTPQLLIEKLPEAQISMGVAIEISSEASAEATSSPPVTESQPIDVESTPQAVTAASAEVSAQTISTPTDTQANVEAVERLRQFKKILESTRASATHFAKIRESKVSSPNAEAHPVKDIKRSELLRMLQKREPIDIDATGSNQSRGK